MGTMAAGGSRRRRTAGTRVLGLCLALAAIAALAGASSAGAAVPRSFYGISPQFPPPSTGEINRMGQGNVGTLHMWVNWGGLDPSPAPGDTQWATVDPLVGAAAANGIQVLPYIYGTPEWVAAGLEGRACSADCHAYAPVTPAGLAAWQQFVSEAVARYGPGGSFWAQNPQIPALPVSAWQLWSEQNSPVYFKPTPSPKMYANLLAAGANGVHAVDPSADVVLGGMAGLPGVQGALTSWKFLAKLYKVKGTKSYFDGVAPHPYASRVKGVIKQIDKIRAAMKKGRDKRTDMWITEIGWGSDSSGHPLSVGPAKQGKNLKEIFKYLRKKRRKLHIASVLWFSFMDSQNQICLWCANSGLLSAGLVPKPAWGAYTKFTGGS